MQANPLISPSNAPGAKSAVDPSTQRVITLVSNVPANQIAGLDGFLKAFSSDEARAEVDPFRYAITRKVRRTMGGKFSSGLSQEVTETVEINPNEDLFGMRRWLGGIRQDAASVMLLNVNKIKEDSLAAPLIFSELLKTGRPILVSGADRSTQDQLLARIVPDCSKVPDAIAYNSSLKSMFLQRPARRKGFQGTIRYLLDMEFLPPEVMAKVQKISTGGDGAELSEAETINLCLLSDLASRYRSTFALYKESLNSGTMNIQQLVSLFEILTADLPLKTALVSFDEFLGNADERPEVVNNKAELFGHLNRYINATGGSSRGSSRSEKLDQVFKRLNSVVVGHRAKVDPLLWERCSFVFDPDDGEKALLNSLEPLHMFIKKTIDGGEEAINEDFKTKMGSMVFELVVQANQSLDEVQKSGGMDRMRAAQHFLPYFQMPRFQAGHLVQISPSNRETLLKKDKFLGLFTSIPMTVKDLQTIWDRLDQRINYNQMISDQVRASTLDVVAGHERNREKALRDIYIINAALELVHFSFHIGEHNITSLDRLCGVAVSHSRFGFEVGLQPAHESSIGLYATKDVLPLGKLQNDPSVLSRAYTALIGMQIERQVKKAVDHKIGYLQQTFGDNFFEVIYQQVVTQNDIPLSRNQLAWFIKDRGLLGNLMDKGFRSERENDLQDDFMTLEKPSLTPGKSQRNYKEFEQFVERYQAATGKFKHLLAELRASAEEDPTQNVRSLIWSLFRRGIYNLDRAEAREAFRKSIYYNTLKELIAKTSSENYSVFTKEIQGEGVKVYLAPRFHYLLTLGTRFGFLVDSKVVRYQLIGSPAETLEELDPLSRVFNEKMMQSLVGEDLDPTMAGLAEAGREVQRAREIWREHSRHLAFALLDRFLGETVIKQLKPGRVLPPNLLYLPDHQKLGLGPSQSAQRSIPFAKILQVPENMGNLQKNTKTCSTTIDDFTIEVHKISRLAEELAHIESVGEDVLDIIQNLTHERAESQLVGRYEQALGQMVRLLSRPLRHYTEKEVEALHQLASAMKSTLQSFYNTPGSQKDQLVMRVQSQLQARRSDGHSLRLNFTDPFVLDKTQIRVMEKVQQGDQIVSKQRKVEVEVDAKYQTLSSRIREVIRTHQILQKKRHIIFSPEGQKKKQIDYMLDIIDVMQSLRGNALVFYMDSTMLTDDQMNLMATRVKPHNFFRMDDIKPEPPEGMEATIEKDPLSGRMIKKIVKAGTAAAAANSADANGGTAPTP